jgi:hypothetical protein
MRFPCLFVIRAALGSSVADEQLIDGSLWDDTLEYLDYTTDVEYELPVRPPRAGFLMEIPHSCRRGISIFANTEYARALKAILPIGIVPSLNDMFRLGGPFGKYDIRYNSMHSAVRNFRRGLEVSSAALRAMLEIKKEHETMSGQIFWKQYRTIIKAIDPIRNTRCELLIWYKFVISDVPANPRVEDLEVEEDMSPEGYVVYRPVGSALKGMVEFELKRITL